jgi:hypothetical protein
VPRAPSSLVYHLDRISDQCNHPVDAVTAAVRDDDSTIPKVEKLAAYPDGDCP